ncbi:helix-turn-helix domain-containing protein [Nocardioides sp. GY 10127]|uniref:TetR/AcrR family transcriptional regulator n=1 Tax=Nocardioides sp. GY 10127 TaxID=2569762 RepID=UPI00145865C2|nr:helix-turn-helix domain-containing protein [Nocardioides sp. GY 10127]
MSGVEADEGRAGRRGPYAKSARRREQILDTAIEVFAERGVDGTSLRAIGDAVGTTHAALRHYFPSRDALLVEVLRRREGRMLEELEDSGPFGSLQEATKLNATTPGIVALHTSMLAAAVQDSDGVAAEYFTERYRAARAALAERLREGLTDGAARSEQELLDLAAVLLAVSDGLQVQWLMDPDVDLVRTFDLLARLVSPSAGG